MIELIIRDYLKENDMPAYLNKPTDQSDYVLIEVVGGGRENFLNNAMITIESYGSTLQDAAIMNERVKDLMLGNGIDTTGIAANTEVSSCYLNGNSHVSDTTRKINRYQAVFDIYY